MSRLPLLTASLTFALLALLAASALAQDQGRLVAPPSSLLGARFEGLFVDRPDDAGAIWARGTTYKLGFEKGRAIYVPLFGSRAPRSYPLELELRSLRCGDRPIELAPPSAPRVAGARVAIERSPLVETWDLEPARAEQSFVLDAPLGTGALELRLSLRTELLSREQRESELVFEQPGLGVVSYGEAVAIDSRGERASLALALEDGEIVLRVPAEYLAQASYPMIVDPVLRTFAVDTSANDTVDPDVAYDATHQVWLVVGREIVSATDSDIRCLRFSGDGTTLLDTVYAESSSALAHSPSVADNATHACFLVVWGETSSGFDRVRCRERSAASTSQLATVVVATMDLTRDIDATDVGGASAGGDVFLVLWKQVDPAFPNLNQTVFCRGVAVGGALRQGHVLSGTVSCSAKPRVSKDSGPHRRWIATWTSDTISPCGGDELQFVVIDEQIGLAQAETRLNGSLTGRDLRPVAAGDGERFFLAWQRDDAVPRMQSDLFGVRVQRPRGIFAWNAAGAPLALSQLEPNVVLSADQTAPTLAFDGCRYLYAYSEASGGGAPRPFAATFLDLGTALQYHEGHVALSNAASGVAHSSVKSSARHGGEPGHALVVWQQIGNGGRDLGGSLVDVRTTSGGIRTLDTSCPDRLLRTTLGTGDVPGLGRNLELAMSNVQGVPLLLIGLPSAPLSLCTSFTGTCSLGVALPTIAALPASGARVRIPCDALLLGGTVAAQGIDLGAGFGCPAALFGVAFRTTETLLITVQ